MKDDKQRTHRLWLPILTALTLVLVACVSSTPSSAGPERPVPSEVPITTGQAHVEPITPKVPVASIATHQRGAAELTGQSCAAAAVRAMAAIVALLPPGTSSKPQHVTTCSNNHPLDVLYPATGAETSTVTVEVTAATATDCQQAASGAGMQCVPLNGHPGVINAEAICAGFPCVQDWVFGDGFLVVVRVSPFNVETNSRVGSQTPGGLGIGVAVLAALTT